jgi:DNA-directed RNA polymerase specialized sigma subunit
VTDGEVKVQPLATPLTPSQQELVLETRGFAHKATRFQAFKYRGVLAREDIAQLIHLALVESARLFDPEHGSSFLSFAWPRIFGALARAAGAGGADIDLRRNVAVCLNL